MDGAADTGPQDRRRRWIRWLVIGVTVTVATAICATRGLNMWEVESRVADVVRAHQNSTRAEVARAVEREFADSSPQYLDMAGAPHNPVSASGVSRGPLVQRFEDDTVRVTVEYAEADIIPTGSGVIYCLVIDVPVKGASHRNTAEPEFHNREPCGRAHLEVAQP